MNSYSIFSNTSTREMLVNKLPLHKPLSLFIEVTTLCNFRCKMCVRSFAETNKDIGSFKDIDFQDFEKAIAELKDWDAEKLKLLRLSVLGEPLINPRICEMVQIAKEADVAETVDIITNASLLTEEISGKLIDYGLDAIRISVYSVIEEKHKGITGSVITPKAIFRNVKKLRDLRDQKGKEKPYIIVKMFDTFSDENKLFQEMYQNVADEVTFEKVHNSSNYKGVDLIDSFYDGDSRAEETKQDYQKATNQLIACPRPFMSMVISKTGDILCCTSDTPSATAVGNIKTSTLREIWNSKELFEFRKMHLEDRRSENLACKNCDWFKLYPIEDCVDGFPVEKLRPKGDS